MKRVLFLLFLLQINVCSHAGKAIQMNDVQKMGLKGKVKSYAQYATKVVNDTLTKDYLKKVTLFDEKGNKIESRTYNPKKGLISKTQSKVGSKGKVLEEKVYNQNGEESGRTDNKYDKKGRLVNAVKISAKGDTISQWTFSYDKKGRKSASQYKDPQKVLETTYTYDKKNNVSEMTIFQNQQLRKKENFTYNQEGKLTTWSKYNGKDSTLCTVTMYNAWGMQTSKKISLNGEPYELFIFENDNRGNKTAIFHYDDKIKPETPEHAPVTRVKDQSLIDIEIFNYDLQDNKTLRQKIKNGQTIEGEINEFTYF